MELIPCWSCKMKSLLSLWAIQLQRRKAKVAVIQFASLFSTVFCSTLWVSVKRETNFYWQKNLIDVYTFNVKIQSITAVLFVTQSQPFPFSGLHKVTKMMLILSCFSVMTICHLTSTKEIQFQVKTEKQIDVYICFQDGWSPWIFCAANKFAFLLLKPVAIK